MKVLRKRVGEPLETVETDEKFFIDCAKSFSKRMFGQNVFICKAQSSSW